MTTVQEIRELYVAATGGPWTPAPGGRSGAIVSRDRIAIQEELNRYGDAALDVDAYGGALIGESLAEKNARLILAMHELCMELVACAETLAYVRDHVRDDEPAMWERVDTALGRVGL